MRNHVYTALFILVLAALTFPRLSPAKNASTPKLGRAPSTPRVASDPLKVRGQTRNLNMGLVLKGREDRIRVIQERKNYTREIRNTRF